MKISSFAVPKLAIRIQNDMWGIKIIEMNTTNKFTPTLQAKLDKAREEHKNGETLCFNTAQDAIAWMESL